MTTFVKFNCNFQSQKEIFAPFWKRVVAPELVEMCVPRNLLPFILPQDDSCKSFISTSIPYTSEEMEVANILVDTLNTAQTCSKLTVADNEVQNLHVNGPLAILPWGGTSEGITLCNTCPIDIDS